MPQQKFSVHETQAEFLSNYKVYSSKDKSAMVRKAIDQLQSRLELDAPLFKLFLLSGGMQKKLK